MQGHFIGEAEVRYQGYNCGKLSYGILRSNRIVHRRSESRSMTIEFNRPIVMGNELDYMADAIRKGHMSGDGEYTAKCHALLREELGAAKAMLTTSCTHALEMSALLLDFKPGDEIIVPSFTFVSTVNAFVLRGATPVFIDIRADTLNLDSTLLESKITPRTRAILPVHYAGVGCDMDKILEISGRHNVAVVEDNAHGLFGRFRGKYLGTFGALATQSFHATKNFTCGEGGALIINDPQFVDRAEIIREKGTNRGRFFRGQVDKYTWMDVGSSYLPSDLLAAFLYAQFEARQTIQSRRKKIWEFYARNLQAWAAGHGVQLPHVPDDCEQPYHLFYMLMPDLDTRQKLIAYLRSRDIQSAFHYVPLHLSDMGRGFGGGPGDCPITERISDQLVRLPFHNALTEGEVESVVRAVTEFSF